MPSIKRRNFSSNKLRRSPMAHIRKNGWQTLIIFSRGAPRKRNLRCSPETALSQPNFRHYRFLCIASGEKKQQPSSVAKTVLIADDSASMRLSFRLLLEGRHTEVFVREATDGVDAIEKAKKSRPDLILLDLAMPRLKRSRSGHDLEGRYARNTSHLIYDVYGCGRRFSVRSHRC